MHRKLFVLVIAVALFGLFAGTATATTDDAAQTHCNGCLDPALESTPLTHCQGCFSPSISVEPLEHCYLDPEDCDGNPLD